MSKYDEIIGLPHHVSDRHAPMSLYARAAQFAPFAALSGHDEAIGETARLTSERIELSADAQQALSARLSYALEHPDMAVTITYFQPDPLKAGGAYLTAHAAIKKLDETDSTLLLADGPAIPLRDIAAIHHPDFADLGILPYFLLK